MTRRTRGLVVVLTAVALLIAAVGVPPVRRLFHPLVLLVRGRQTVEQRVDAFTAARARVHAACVAQGIAFPPQRLVLVGLKRERVLEVYAGPADAPPRLIGRYPVQAASGELGPKLREGDRRVPEGVYALDSLNPNSRFHVALRVAYPNALDIEQARRDGRTALGGDIMIHGGAASVGCLAMGDDAAEDLFVLAAMAGVDRVTVVLSPVDLRDTPLPPELGNADDPRYAAIRQAMPDAAR